MTQIACRWPTEATLRPERKPTIRIQDVQIHGLSLELATLLFNVEVTNHYRSTLPLLGTECVLSVRGQRLLGGMAGPVSEPGAGRQLDGAGADGTPLRRLA